MKNLRFIPINRMLFLWYEYNRKQIRLQEKSVNRIIFSVESLALPLEIIFALDICML